MQRDDCSREMKQKSRKEFRDRLFIERNLWFWIGTVFGAGVTYIVF